MEVKDLRYFVAVYEAKNFAQASTALHTVQSNVSAHIRKREHFLGVALFERHRRGAVLTDRGERLYRYAKKVIALVDEAAAAGYHVLAVAVDTLVAGRRIRDVRNGLTIPPELSLRRLAGISSRPAYWMRLLRSPAIRRIAPLTVGAAQATHGSLNREVVVMGTTANMLEIRHMDMAQGRFLPQADPRRHRPEDRQGHDRPRARLQAGRLRPGDRSVSVGLTELIKERRRRLGRRRERVL